MEALAGRLAALVAANRVAMSISAKDPSILAWPSDGMGVQIQAALRRDWMPMNAESGAPKSHLRQAIEAFVATLPSNAPLRDVIVGPDIERQLFTFDAADRIAIEKQQSYRRIGRVALWAMTISVSIGALALMPLDDWIGGWPSRIVTSLQTIALVVAVVAVLWISLRQPVDQWMQARAKAEAIRADVFRSIMRVSDARADAKQLLREKFECFKSAHLDNQLEFFERRGGQALRSCGRATPVRLAGYLLTVFAVLFGVAAFVTGWSELGLPMWRPLLSAAEWFLVPDAHRWQLGLGTVASSVLAFASAKSLMDQDERNATCYRVAAEQIKEVVDKDLASTQQAIATGDAEVVLAFCDRVQSILAAENLAWMYARPPNDTRPS